MVAFPDASVPGSDDLNVEGLSASANIAKLVRVPMWREGGILIPARRDHVDLPAGPPGLTDSRVDGSGGILPYQ
jgi:hypothetical protein